MAGATQTSLIVNFVNDRMRALSTMIGFQRTPKHDHYKDFGWPEDVNFDMLYKMYIRNGLASSAVDKTIGRTWQDHPTLWETETPKESRLEKEVAKRFEELRIWQHCAEADRRSMVGSYSGLILQIADDQKFDQPLKPVKGGLNALVGIIPAWESQLTIASYETNEKLPTYGQPNMYEFRERALGGNNQSPRSFKVHPSRVIIWSDDGTVFGRSMLRSGYNDLIDAEKVKGAGGEGFWKSARGAPIIEAPEGMKPQDVAKAMGINKEDLVDAVSEQVEAFAQGFDKALLLGGMKATPMSISLPEPEHFFLAPVQSYAASMLIPHKILMGSQTGERASTEDTREWNQVNMSRRTNRNRPLILDMVRRLVQAAILPERDWWVGWADLTESTAAEKMARAKDLSGINQQQLGTSSTVVFTDDELREAAGYKPLDPKDKVEYPKPKSDPDKVDDKKEAVDE